MTDAKKNAKVQTGKKKGGAMEESEHARSLKALAVASTDRTNMGRIRTLYPEIEDAQKAGLRLESIHKELATKGLTISFDVFKNALYRIRKERKNGASVVRIKGNVQEVKVIEKPPRKADPTEPKKYTFDSNSPVDDLWGK